MHERVHVGVGSDGDITISPVNKVVRNGASNVTISCASSNGFRAISWSYVPIGGSSSAYIATGSTVASDQNQYYAVDQSGSQQSNLIILRARMGTYTCNEGALQASAQLILICKFIFINPRNCIALISRSFTRDDLNKPL